MKWIGFIILFIVMFIVSILYFNAALNAGGKGPIVIGIINLTISVVGIIVMSVFYLKDRK